MAAVIVTEPLTKGKVIIKTSIGDIGVELWPDQAPKAVRNFVQLAMEGFYDGCVFHRVVPGFIAQTGDPSGTGRGGESIYDEHEEGFFGDEFDQRLKFNRRGLVAMANTGKRNTNLSQFFVTLDATPSLQNRNTIFGRINDNTLYNALKMNEIEMDPNQDERPLYPPTIKSIEILDNPFEDIQPRITAKEKKTQERARKEERAERKKEKVTGRRKAVKNSALLSFGDAEEAPSTDQETKFKIISAHEALDDPTLRATTGQAGGKADLPTDLLESLDKMEKERATTQPKVTTTRAEKAKTELTPFVPDQEKKKESASTKASKLAEDLKKLVKRAHDSDSDGEKDIKKKKHDGKALLMKEREKYSQVGSKITLGTKSKASKGNVNLESEMMKKLESFKAKLVSATQQRAGTPTEEDQEEGKDDDLDAGWLSHRLKFRKDATLDQHSILEYELIDPLSRNKEGLSLEEMKNINRNREKEKEMTKAAKNSQFGKDYRR